MVPTQPSNHSHNGGDFHTGPVYAAFVSEDVDPTVPQTARIWNYWLGGTDNFPVDRAVGDEIRQAFPQIVDNARASRDFLVRAVGHVTREAGIRQLLDVGSGLPTADNTHEVAQRIAPESRGWRVLIGRTRNRAGHLAFTEGGRVDDLLPVDGAGDSLTHPVVVQRRPPTVEHNPVVI